MHRKVEAGFRGALTKRMVKMKTNTFFSGAAALIGFVMAGPSAEVLAQDRLPREQTPFTYHESPEYRESESHPLRVAAYIFHPIGWVAREVLFRPLSYFASSTPTRRSVMGYRSPFDFREPTCFPADATVPNCRTISPFNQAAWANGGSKGADEGLGEDGIGRRQVAFGSVNFDFDKATLNERGKAQVAKIAENLKKKQDQDETSIALVLEGHTDEVGTEEYNMVLGKKRAEAVKTELALVGIDQSRTKTVSFGESQPAEEGTSADAQAANRRVEVHID